MVLRETIASLRGELERATVSHEAIDRANEAEARVLKLNADLQAVSKKVYLSDVLSFLCAGG